MDYLNDLESVWGMDDTPEKVKVLEHLIAAADAHNDVQNGIYARDLLVETCLTMGFTKKQLQAFSWIIKKWESEDSDVYINTEDFLWKYTWFGERAPTFEDISKKQISNILMDMKVKHQQQNYALRPCYKVFTFAAMRMGKVDEAKKRFEQWISAETDLSKQCPICEAQNQVYYYFFMKDFENAKKLAQPIIEEEQGCHEIPHQTYAMMALVYLELGDKHMAQECFDKGYPMVHKEMALIPPISYLLEFLIKTNQLEKAREVLNSNREIVLKSENGLDQLLFLQAAYPLFDREKEADLIEMTEALTAKFDARNGNNYYQDCLEA
ncbi:hypothetical protein HB969_03745 [Listeria welshimeri]|nr:hypothetical protein [Listeria welshimeri]MBC2200299.1 hypothetical protein [Listeria welshimeri]